MGQPNQLDLFLDYQVSVTEPVNDFYKQLNDSHLDSELPVWEEAYKKFFPNFKCSVYFQRDSDFQRLGGDRQVICDGGKNYVIDEKIRYPSKSGRVYTDILLEYVSNNQRNSPGWVCKPLLADYIAYYVKGLGLIYMLPVGPLQIVWEKHKDVWLQREDQLISAQNKGYKTLSFAIEPSELFGAIFNNFTIQVNGVKPLEN